MLITIEFLQLIINTFAVILNLRYAIVHYDTLRFVAGVKVKKRFSRQQNISP